VQALEVACSIGHTRVAKIAADIPYSMRIIAGQNRLLTRPRRRFAAAVDNALVRVSATLFILESLSSLLDAAVHD